MRRTFTWALIAILVAAGLILSAYRGTFHARAAEIEANTTVYLPLASTPGNPNYIPPSEPSYPLLKQENVYYGNVAATYKVGNQTAVMFSYDPNARYMAVPLLYASTFGSGPNALNSIPEGFTEGGSLDQALAIPFGAYCGTAILSGSVVFPPVGVIILAVGLTLVTAYAIYAITTGDTTLQNLLPKPGQSEANDLARGLEWLKAMEEAQGTSNEESMAQDTVDFNNPSPEPPDQCRPFRNSGGGNFPSGWRLSVDRKLADDARVTLYNAAGDMVGYSEATKLGQFGMRYVYVAPAYRKDKIGTVLNRISGDLLAEANGQSGAMKFIIHDMNNFKAYSCLVWDSLNVLRMTEKESVAQHASFRTEAARYGIPNY